MSNSEPSMSGNMVSALGSSLDIPGQPNQSSMRAGIMVGEVAYKERVGWLNKYIRVFEKDDY